MKIKLSKSQWDHIGRKAGWEKVAQNKNTLRQLERIADALVKNPEYLMQLLVSKPEGINFLKSIDLNGDPRLIGLMI